MKLFNKEIKKYINKYLSIEKNIIGIGKKAMGMLAKLSNLYSDFEKSVSQLNILNELGDKFDLPYSDHLTNSSGKLYNYIKTLKRQIDAQSLFYNSDLFDFLRFQHNETLNFKRKLSEKSKIKQKMLKLKKTYKNSDFDRVEKIKDMNIFHSYLDFSTHYNFKHFFIHRNIRMNRILATDVSNDIYVLQK